ncbi:uncharacterized protein LOC100141760 isoform X6 [Tribolium castaneum]|uniref:uncharacterized protein LOC100141760 isoform X6 n=1 Tax=Tribolium castaneum TaxID=7070 RepID=UPI00046C3A3B|nr:PREDICTED: uncharacterized protein LOC100141760 isoform X6 [Tribolium castaneum]|eukprot:XP_008197113.1 PREDICTED: uncharacterized protein LOC100141760 isoform X6 [Tribolium castaneum]
MVSKVVQFELKLKTLLGKIQDRCDRHLDASKLVDHFWQLEQKHLESTIITLPLFTEWLKQAVVTWSRKKVTPETGVALFTLNLASLLSRKEKVFCDLNNNNFYIKLINILKVRHLDVAPSVKLAYIKLLSSFLEHKSGIEWMIVCTFWEDIFKLSLSDKSEICDQSIEFVSIILEKAIGRDEIFCNNVVKRIISPLGVNVYKCLKNPTEAAIRALEPSLKLIAGVLEFGFVRVLTREKDFRIAFLFLDNLRLEELIDDLVLLSQAYCRSIYLVKIMFVVQFLELHLKVLTSSVSFEFAKSSISTIRYNFTQYFCKTRCYRDVIELCSFGYSYWSLVNTKIGFDNAKKNQFSFSDHDLCLLLLPHASLLLKNFLTIAEWENRNFSDDCRDLNLYYFVRSMDPSFLRIGYTWRSALATSPDLVQTCTLTLVRLRKILHMFSKVSAMVVFKMFIYVLKDLVSTVEEMPQKLETLRCETYFTEMFAFLSDLIEKFEITWKDNFEAVSVIAVAFDFLMLYSWPTNEVVQALKLINVAVRNYMSPNLSLLVDITSDTTLEMLGPLLVTKLSGAYEVKRASLDVVLTMSQMSLNKFPSLQKVLMDSELPTLVVKMSTCDSESFVRATAIKCLQEMIQVEEIWNNALKSEDLPQKMRDVLLNETEGIVRVEAATFMCVAYENQQFPKDTLDRVYETMIYASTTDLHWEVKVRALDFWDKVIKNHLQNQGMIDGSFPNVTFSKEHRKIVTLTDSEIRKRLLKVLSQLSSIGCLGVLMSAIKDDCDMEVSKTAAKITQRLVELFKKYNVRSDGSTPTSPLPTENGMSTASVSSGISVDESMDSPSNHHELNEDIIDQIVNSKDVCLLRNVYAPSEYSSVSNYDIQVRRVVTPNEFLQFTQQDLNTIISEKKNWLNGIEDLGSLLDDMLKTYEDDVNNMDCY